MTHDGLGTTDGRSTTLAAGRLTSRSAPAPGQPTGLAGLTWRKSSFSGPQGGECVEVATTADSALVRDSKRPHGGRLTVAAGAWDAFLAGIRKGEFDLG